MILFFKRGSPPSVAFFFVFRQHIIYTGKVYSSGFASKLTQLAKTGNRSVRQPHIRSHVILRACAEHRSLKGAGTTCEGRKIIDWSKEHGKATDGLPIRSLRKRERHATRWDYQGQCPCSTSRRYIFDNLYEPFFT